MTRTRKTAPTRRAARAGAQAALLLGSALATLPAALLAAQATQATEATEAASLNDQQGASQSAQATESHAFEIPRQPLARALELFAEQSDLQLAYSTGELAGLTGQAVSGRYPTEVALRLLLADSEVTWRFTDDRTLVLERAPGGATLLQPMTVEGRRETATGPFEGYIATRSATGTKTDTPLLETPQSISVIGREQIERQQSQTVGDALRYTPGILKGQGFNRTNDGFYMRGFQINDQSIYVNGLRSQPNIFSTTVEPYGLERIEVLRGPASVLYGQSDPGGLVNMETKRPTLEPLHEIEVQAGSYDHKQVATDHGGALDAEGDFSYRLTALARKSDTMVDDIGDDKVFVAPSLTWRPDEDTSFTLLASYTKAWTAYYYGFPAEGTVLPNPNGRIARDRFLGEPDFNDWTRTAYSAGYEVEHRLDEVFQLRQNLRYSEFQNDYADIYFGSFLPGERSVTRGAYARQDDSSLFSVDSQLQADFATGALDHTLLVGVDYGHGSFDRVQHNGTVAPLDLYDPVYGAPVALSATPGTDIYETQDQFGLYAQDQLALGNWRLLLGGRHDWADNETDNRITATKTRASQSAFTGRAGLVYLSEIGVAPYVSYAESFQPQSGTDAAGGAFEPTTGTQYELGVKYQPPGADSSVTLSAFHLTRQNVLTSDPDNPGFSVQTGEIRSRGVEVEAKLTLLEGFNLLAGYAYTDAEVTESNGSDLGNRPANSPEHMASLWGEYAFQQGDLEGFYFGGGVRYVGDTVNLADSYTAPSYTLYDAVAGYDSGAWRFTLNARNLFDKQYVAACTYGCFYGEGRSVIGTVAFRW